MEGAALKWKHAATHITSISTVCVHTKTNLEKAQNPGYHFPFNRKPCGSPPPHSGNHKRPRLKAQKRKHQRPESISCFSFLFICFYQVQ